MSDISKAWQIKAQLEAITEFKFQSLLSEYIFKFSESTKKYMADISKGTGISVPDISGYRCDRKVLTDEHAEKLADYFHQFGAKATPQELIGLQKVGQMIDLRGKSIMDELQELGRS